MKKILLLFTCLGLVLGITGCGNNDKEKEEENTTYNDYSDDEAAEKEKFLIYDYFFENDLSWNMGYAEAKDIISFATIDETHSLAPGNQITGSTGSLEYVGHGITGEVENSDNYVFLFPGSILKAYYVKFNDKLLRDNGDYIDLYKSVKEKVVSLYGEPNLENYNWTDETYKGYENDWSKAFNYGYLTIETQWTTQESKDIVIKWSYKNGLNLIICEKGYIPNL